MATENMLPLAMLDKVSVKLNGVFILEDISLTIARNERWALVGNSGSGKTTLAKALTGRIFHQGNICFHFEEGKGSASVILIDQQHHFKNLSNTSDFYYQQRFNSSDSEDALTVEQYLESIVPASLHNNYWTFEKTTTLLNLGALLNKQIIKLSNGETK